MDLPLSSFVSHFVLLTGQGVYLRYRWLPYACKQEFSIFFEVTGLIADVFLILFFICNAVKQANITEKQSIIALQ